MIVISFGVRKSGSTLAFEMAKAVLELNGHPQPKLADGLVEEGRPSNTVGRWTDERLARLVRVTEGTKIVIKTHGPPNRLTIGKLLGFVESGRVRIHVVYRDPRDAVLAILDHGARSRAENRQPLSQVVDVDDAIPILRKDVTKLRRWGMFPSLKLLYDDFAFDPEKWVARIAEDLGVSVDVDEAWKIVNDRETKKGVASPHRHREEMTPGDAARIAAALPDYLELTERNDPEWFQRWPSGAP